MQEHCHLIHRALICFGMPAVIHANNIPQNRLGGLDNRCVHGKLGGYSSVSLEVNVS